MQTTVLIESSIENRIRTSSEIDDHQKESFLRLLSYFTPSEIAELAAII